MLTISENQDEVFPVFVEKNGLGHKKLVFGVMTSSCSAIVAKILKKCFGKFSYFTFQTMNKKGADLTAPLLFACNKIRFALHKAQIIFQDRKAIQF